MNEDVAQRIFEDAIRNIAGFWIIERAPAISFATNEVVGTFYRVTRSRKHRRFVIASVEDGDEASAWTAAARVVREMDVLLHGPRPALSSPIGARNEGNDE